MKTTCKTCNTMWDRQTYICCPACFRKAVRNATLTQTLEKTREAQEKANRLAIRMAYSGLAQNGLN